MRFAVIEAGVVVNIAEAQPGFASEQDWVHIMTPDVAIGWLYDGEAFSPPAEALPVPQSITPRQGKLALLDAGLLDEAEDVIAAADRAAQISWADATEFRRDNPLIAAIGAALNLTKDQIDDLFRAAALIP